ncbi:MAG TPA: aspartyl protease family protein, partial [Flavisolibacter sp.]|nr:aspartyl protease family protein [Flavisolibacter sp.]
MKHFFFSLFFLAITFHHALAQDTLVLKKYVANLKKVDLMIEGQFYSFLFDTGGGETFISPEIAKRLGKPIYGQATSLRMSGEKVTYQKCDSITLKAGDINLFHSTIGVWDIMSILPTGLPKIDGVLSLKSFKDKIITLDLGKERLIVESNKSFK